MEARKEDAESTQAEPPIGSVRRVSARELLGSARTLQIEHNGEVYTLRLTRNDRLILTK
jgi:hemin uptake protein HemP